MAFRAGLLQKVPGRFSEISIDRTRALAARVLFCPEFSAAGAQYVRSEGVQGPEGAEGVYRDGMIREIREVFGAEEVDLRGWTPLQFAFLGDAVYELIIRTILAEQGGKPHEMSEQKTRLVCAKAQSEIAVCLRDSGVFTQEEADAFRRGKNASPPTRSHSSSLQDYHRATGLEALLGWLYLSGQEERAAELVREGLARTGQLPGTERTKQGGEGGPNGRDAGIKD